MGCFWSKYIIFDLKMCRGVMFDGTEYWCKIWKKTDLCFQKWHKEFSKFSPENVWKSKNWDFYWIFLSKVEDYNLKIYRGVMCHGNSRMMQNLKKNWIVSSKLTWGISWILTRGLRNLKQLHLNGLLLTKVYNVWAKKVQRSYVWWHWISMQNLKENWLVLSKMTLGI